MLYHLKMKMVRIPICQLYKCIGFLAFIIARERMYIKIHHEKIRKSERI